MTAAGETGSLEADREVALGCRLQIGCAHRKAWSRPSDSGRLLGRPCDPGVWIMEPKGAGRGCAGMGVGLACGGSGPGGGRSASPPAPAPELLTRRLEAKADAGALFPPSTAPCRDPLRGSGRLGCSQLTSC